MREMKLRYVLRVVLKQEALNDVMLVRVFSHQQIRFASASDGFAIVYFAIPASQYAGRDRGFVKAFDMVVLEKFLELDHFYGGGRDYFVARAMERFFGCGLEGRACPVTSSDWAFDVVRNGLGEEAVEAFALMLLALYRFGVQVGGNLQPKTRRCGWLGRWLGNCW